MRIHIAISLALFLPGIAFAQTEEREEARGYVAVVASAALEKAVAPLLEHRRAEGLKVDVVRIAPGAQDALVAELKRRAPDFILLVGDVDTIPAFVVREAATDRPYGDYDGDGYPDAAIGRFPVSHPQVVSSLVERTLAYERDRAAGAWRKQCALVAGEAKFSPGIDKFIEQLFQQVVCDSVNPAYDVDMTYANPRSPYCCPAKRFSKRVVQRMNEGALVFAYVGHGSVRSVDTLDVVTGKGKKKKTRKYTVLKAAHAKRLKTGANSPVFLSIACWTGKYEGKTPCIGEELLLTPGGPVGFLGSSRISHPVHNALLAKELVRELLSETGTVRLGPAINRAREAMVKGRPDEGPDPVRKQILDIAAMFIGLSAVTNENPRHVDMYNLLGDPALRLARPEEWIALEGATDVTAGATLAVTGKAPAGFETLTVTLETAREKSARPEPESESVLQRYKRVNDKVVATVPATVAADGTFSVSFDLDRRLPKGTYRIKAFAQVDGRAAIGAVAQPIAADPTYDPFDE